MQLRGIFVSASLLIGASAFAQGVKPITMQTPSRVIKNDSLIPASKAGGKLLAANLPVAAPPAPFKGVPLAGHKAYFGAMTDYVNGFVRQYLGAHNKTLSAVEGRGNKKFSLVDNILKRHDIPAELKYLAVIESALNNKAVSPVGAVGPWQLMESTARLMGLTVNGKRDDRTDWFKSTNAAAKYLTYLHNQLNDWLLVVAAYNSGPTLVMRAIERTGSRNFWDIKKYLPRETQGHVLAFIATASIFEKMKQYIGPGQLPSDFKFGNEEQGTGVAKSVEPPKPLFTKEELERMAIVRLNEPVNPELLFAELGIDRKVFEKWNPDYELFTLAAYAEDFYRLRIPKDKLDNFVEKKEYLTKKTKQIYAAEIM